MHQLEPSPGRELLRGRRLELQRSVVLLLRLDPGFVPHPPACSGTEIQGAAVVPAPSLPILDTQATSVPFYAAAGQQLNRGTYTEMTPGVYNNFSLTGGAGCYFLDAGVYTWNGGYTSHGGLVSNELKAPEEELWGPLGVGPGTSAGAVAPFWANNGCDGNFNLSLAVAPGQGIKHQGGGSWGVELTAVRYDRFIDPNIGPNPCFSSARLPARKLAFQVRAHQHR